MKIFLLLLFISAIVFGQLEVNKKYDSKEHKERFSNNEKDLLYEEEFRLESRKINENRKKYKKQYHSKNSSIYSDVDENKSVFNTQEVPQIEKDALVALYNSTDGANWIDNTNWLSSEPVDTWYGVYVENDHVTAIYLDDNNLVGSLPSEIGNLTELIELFFWNNQITGNIPSQIGNLSQLLYLDFEENQITGSIPPEIGNLSFLVELYLNDNLLSGNIPSEIENLTFLYSLILNNNQLSGIIPPEIGNMTWLTEIVLWNNQLTGPIPSEIGNLVQLERLSLSGNQLSGEIPTTIGNLTSLTTLSLWNNQLSGTIPSEIGNLTLLSNLWLSRNELSGTIPTEIGDLVKLISLTLYDNHLTGDVPSEIGNLNLLEQLSVRTNNLSGSIPSQINNLDSLIIFHINYNKFDELPNLSGLTNLYNLYIQGNEFTFEDIIPNINVASDSISYAPQDSVGTLQNTTLSEGDPFNVSVTVGGNGNQYQWIKDGASISGATNSSYSISSVLSSDEGSYICEITNSSAPLLTLYSKPVNLTVETIIFVFTPTISHLVATNITNSSATLNGTINPNGSTTSFLFEFGTTTEYGNFVSTGEELDGSNDINVSLDLEDLESNTLYHYRISATNSSGTSYSDDETFTTNSTTLLSPTATTNSATLVETTTAVLNGVINPNGASTDYYFEYGTTDSYGTQTASKNLGSGSAGISVDESITSLTTNTTYHYRLIATNSGGTTNGSNVTFTTKTDIDLRSTSLSLTTFDWKIGNSVTAELSIKNEGSSIAAPQNTQLYLSDDTFIGDPDIALGNPMSFSSITAGATISRDVTFTVPMTSSGFYYVVGIIDVDSLVSETNEANNYFYRTSKIIIGYPNSTQLSSTFSFGDPTISSSFRLVGLPGNNNLAMSQILPGTSGEDWIAYYDNGNITDYLVSYDGSSNFNFKPGKGFWILAKSNIIISESVNSVELQNLQMNTLTNEIVFPISLHSGWNIISNPFETNVSWDAVRLFNTVNEDIYTFTGSFASVDILEPYKGYYFYNATDITSIYIPYTLSNGTNYVSKQNVTTEESLSIILSGNSKESNVTIGFNDSSQIGYDKFDKFIPPGDFEEQRISIFNENLETGYKYLNTDYRKELHNQIFNLSVVYPKNKKFNLDFVGLAVIEELDIYLVDQNSTFHNMKVENNILLQPSEGMNNLLLLIGDEVFINAQKSALLPKDFTLNQNYPNPFNPITKISFSIPEVSHVNLKIYDTLGKEISILVNEEMVAGNYEVELNGLNLSSGVYFYKFKAGKFVATKKMLLLK